MQGSVIAFDILECASMRVLGRRAGRRDAPRSSLHKAITVNKEAQASATITEIHPTTVGEVATRQ